MKKLVLLLVLVGLLVANFSYATQSTNVVDYKAVEQSTIVKSNFWGKVVDVKQKITQGYEKLKSTLSSTLRTALLLMLIGVIFLVLAGAIGGSIVWAVGAVFFLIGAVLLLLYLL